MELATPAAAAVNPTTGVATAVAPGSSNITAKVGAVQGSAAVTVTPAALAKIAVTPAPTSIAGGATQQFKATGTLTDGTTQDVSATATWTSSNPAVATINSSGLATAVATGGTLTLFAANPGAWGNNVQVTVQSGSPGKFGLQVSFNGQVVESYVNLSVSLHRHAICRNGGG